MSLVRSWAGLVLLWAEVSVLPASSPSPEVDPGQMCPAGSDL